MKVIALVVVICVYVHQSSAGGFQDKTRLLDNLLENYHVDVEPDHADLKFGIGFLCARWDSLAKVVKTSAWERYHWKDSRLSWDPSKYGGVDTVRVSSNNIWIPNFKLYNSLSHEDKRQSTKCIVNHNGTVVWVPGVEYRSQCKPEGCGYDCEYRLGSWSEGSDTVPFERWHVPLLGNYLNSTCPSLATVKSAQIVQRHYPCCTELYGTLDVTLHYTRNTELDASPVRGTCRGQARRRGRGRGH